MPKERIRKKSMQLFFSYGLRGVSMDDVARICGISKKSLYQYFENKNALVCEIVHELIQSHERLLKICHVVAIDAIDEVVKQSAEPFEIWAAIRLPFFFELERYFPMVWHQLDLYRLKMQDCITHNLEWGRQEGLYRANINTVLVAELRLHQLTDFLQRNFVTTQQWSIPQSVMELTSLYLHSITTEKGKNLIDNYIKGTSERLSQRGNNFYLLTGKNESRSAFEIGNPARANCDCK